jgi:hypothetical protein
VWVSMHATKGVRVGVWWTGQQAGKKVRGAVRGLESRQPNVSPVSLPSVRHAHGGGFAGSEVRVTSQRLGGTRVAFLHARTPTHSPPDVKTGRGALRSL